VLTPSRQFGGPQPEKRGRGVHGDYGTPLNGSSAATARIRDVKIFLGFSVWFRSLREFRGEAGLPKRETSNGRSRLGNRPGISLLEAVVAIAIVGMTSVSALEAVGGEMRTAERARRAIVV